MSRNSTHPWEDHSVALAHGTVRSFDPDTRAGDLLTDRGEVVEFGSSAFDRSGLQLLRPGQRVTARLDAAGNAEVVTIAGFPLD